jgi:hypothetical protein
LTEATTKPRPCQVRSKTESPCSRRAEVEILGILFCEACARKQEAYFAIGELTQEEEAQGFGSKPLAEALERSYPVNGFVRLTKAVGLPLRCLS